MSVLKPPSEVARLLHQALAHHQAGRLDLARQLYEQVLKSDPDNADALNLLGVIAQGDGRMGEARQLFERASRNHPNVPDFHFNLGNFYLAANEHDAALAAFEKAIALKPDHAALLNAGVVLQKLAKYAEAVQHFQAFIAHAPQDPRGHYNLGHCFSRAGQVAEAERCFARALELQPQYLDAHVALASLYAEADRIDDAVRHTQCAIALSPQPRLRSNLGDLFKRAGKLEAALAEHSAAVAALPSDAVVLHNYGSTLHAAGRLDEAEVVFRDAIATAPDLVEAYIGLAKVYEHRKAYSEAIATLQKALELTPDSSLLRFKLSMLQLTTGNLREGWRNYEHRLQSVDAASRRPTPPTYWSGEDLAGKTILVWTDQGPGDEILYANMFGDVIARAGQCIIACSARMAPIFARSFPKAKVAPYRYDGAANESFAYRVDVQTAATSLGQFFRTDVAHFPQHQGYLKSDVDLTSALRARYRALAPGNLVVGLSWRSKAKEIGALKSADLPTWSELLSVPGVTFVNLQYGECAAELADVKQRLGVDIFHDDSVDALKSMDDFFAQVAAMDLVVSTSNTTVHAAGSMNVPTWLLLSGAAGGPWYWFENGETNPWYPSVRTRRGGAFAPNTARDGWTPLISDIAQTLRKRVHKYLIL